MNSFSVGRHVDKNMSSHWGVNYWPESSKENNCDDLTTKTGLRTLLTAEWWWWTGSGNNCGQNKVLSDCLMNSRPCLTVKPFPHTHRELNSCAAWCRSRLVSLGSATLSCWPPENTERQVFLSTDVFPPMAVFEVDNTSVHWAQIA